MSEQTTTCPKCGLQCIGARIRPHNCERRQKNPEQYESGKRKANGGKALAVVDRNDAEMGAQLTAQYQRAINAMPEVLKFGAMILMLEEKVIHDGSLSPGRGKKGGLRDWLRNHAPEVPLANALRFRDVVKGIGEDYAQLVGAKVARKFALPELVTAAPEELAPPVRKKQQALFDYVAGTSQKSWLDKIRPPKERGGATCGRAKKLTAEQEQAHFLAACREDFIAWTTGLDRQVLNRQWQAPSIVDGELDAAIAVAEKWLKEARAWLKVPQKRRARADFGKPEDAAEEEEPETAKP